MPQQNDNVTMYKADPKTGEMRALPFERAAVQEAVQKGWALKAPTSGDAAGSAKSPTGGAGGGGGQQPGQIPNMKFGEGYLAGLNPFHMPPQGTPQPHMGMLPNMAAQAVNQPEIEQRFKQRNFSGAIGETMGTLSGLGLQAGGKAAKSIGLAGRAAEDVARSSKAATAGAGLSRDLKVTPDAARFAERYVQPLKEAIDSQFETVHKALAGKAFPLNPAAQRLIRKMGKSEVPAIAKLSEELSGRTALGYEEAKAIMEGLKDIATDEAKHWKPEAQALGKILDDEINTMAKAAGVDGLRSSLLKQYTKMNQILRSVASGASTTEAKARPVADALGGVGPEANIGGIRVGVRSGSGKAMRVPAEAKVEATRLAKQLGLKGGDLKVGTSGLEKAGKGAQVAGAGLDVGKLLRAVMAMMQGGQQDPYVGRQPQ
jgi:hypothetical protein